LIKESEFERKQFLHLQQSKFLILQLFFALQKKRGQSLIVQRLYFDFEEIKKSAQPLKLFEKKSKKFQIFF